MAEPMGATPPAGRLTLAALAGGLVALSMPPWGFWPLSFVGVALFEWVLAGDLSRRWRGGLGFAFAFVWMLVAMAWMWFLTAPGYIVTAALFAAFHAVAAMVAPTGSLRVLGRPAAHAVAEIVRISVPFGGIPLATLGIAQAGGPLLGVARVGGVFVLTWLVLQVGFAAPALVRNRHDLVAAGSLAAVLVVVLVALVAPSGSALSADPVLVAAVQGGGEQGTSALDVPSSAVTKAHLEATATIGSDEGVDLVVWPENGIDVDDQPFSASAAFDDIAAEARRLDAPIAVGVTVDSEFSSHPRSGGFVNAQAIVTPDGELTRAYEKVQIVPFGEYVPMRSVLEALGAPLGQIPSDAVRGRDPAIIETPDGARFGVMISWEVFFGHRGRAADDGEILLNPTNGASYTGTIVQTQQVASSRLRAVETGRWVVQVSPTGFSAFISPTGDVFQRTDVSERSVIVQAVPRRSGTTWYSATGDRPWAVLIVATLGLSLWVERRRARAEPSAVTPRASA